MKHFNVVCAVIIKDNKYFICQRGGNRLLSGLWEFPGGKIEDNETIEETIIREIKEELNSTIKPYKYLGYIDHEYTDIDNPFSITLHAVECELIEGNLTLIEHTDSKWVTKDELNTIDLAYADVLVVKELIK